MKERKRGSFVLVASNQIPQNRTEQNRTTLQSSRMSSSAEFLANLKEAGQTVISTRRPWRVFLDLSLPSSISEATTRLAHNLTYFLFNYALLLLLIFFLSLFFHPLALVLFLLLFAAGYFFHENQLILLLLALLAVVVLVTTGVLLNLVVSVGVWAVVVCLHGVLRSTDELVGDDQESPYGHMLSDTAAAGAYTPV